MNIENTRNCFLRKLPIKILKGSALSLPLGRVNPAPGIVKVTAVAVSVCDLGGATDVYAATAVSGGWFVTVPASKFTSPGTVLGGILVSATGKDENDATRTWKDSICDFTVLDDNGEVVPGVVRYAMQWFDAAPANPTKGNVAIVNGTVKLYNGTQWITFGSGTGDISHSEFAGIDPDTVTIYELATILKGTAQ